MAHLLFRRRLFHDFVPWMVTKEYAIGRKRSRSLLGKWKAGAGRNTSNFRMFARTRGLQTSQHLKAYKTAPAVNKSVDVKADKVSKLASKQEHKIVRVYNIPGVTKYCHGLKFQREKRELKKISKGKGVNEHDVLILLEHNSVYTLGKSSSIGNCLFDINEHNDDYEVHRVERGGEVTYHGPGQVVGYLILDLENHKKDLHWFLRQVEEVIISVLATYGIKGDRHEDYTGVWVGDEKIAAIGLSASKWITMHGFALNVSPEMSAFKRIIPCGIDDATKSVTSMKELLCRQDPKLLLQTGQVRERLIEKFTRVFKFQTVYYHSSLENKGCLFSYSTRTKSE